MDDSDGAIEVVRNVYEALARGDVPALLELSDPDIRIYQSEDLPYGGHHSGHSGLMSFLSGVRLALESEVEVAELYRAGDLVIQMGRTRGTGRATGKVFDAAEVHIWRVENGLVQALTVYADTVAIAAALK